MQALDHQLRQRETALTSAEHRVELLRTRLENDASTTQKAAQAVEAERADIKVSGCCLCQAPQTHSVVTTTCLFCPSSAALHGMYQAAQPFITRQHVKFEDRVSSCYNRSSSRLSRYEKAEHTEPPRSSKSTVQQTAQNPVPHTDGIYMQVYGKVERHASKVESVLCFHTLQQDAVRILCVCHQHCCAC